ncbi:MAG: putative intracellular protease/amidase [Mucilaginibacter sp.]|nr:putative intracellular protease/amidase [Mucilaginibacter sp.]
MKTKINLLLILLSTSLSFQGHAQTKTNLTKQTMNKTQSKKVLIIVTSFSEIKSTGKKTGTWIEEFATPYYLLTDQGIAVTIASPKGGVAPIDPKSAQPEYSTASVKRFYSDAAAQERLNHTLTLDKVNAKDYDAIFYPGGHGPMWDLPDNSLSINLIESFYEQGKPVALVCHAPAALKNVKAKNGEPLIKGKQVSAYSNSEEIAGQSTAETPFSLEGMLKEKGANYVKGEDWKAYAIADGNLITGQNPASAQLVAEKIIASLALPQASK